MEQADQQIAAKAFPLHRCYGAGTIAVRKDCCMEVELVSTTAAAIIVKAEQCSRYCHMAHFIQHRKEPKAITVITNRGYGRDDD